ncbi:MAG: carboxyltransferase subunit alpha [Eubacteriales bacterium]
MVQELQAQLSKMKQDMDLLEHATEEQARHQYHQLKAAYDQLLEKGWARLEPSDRVFLARQVGRPNGKAFILGLCSDFVEFHGDRLSGDDPTVVGGVALFQGLPVTVLALCKGENPEEFLHYNYGMASPSGYRKIQRLARQAEKFNRPILTFIDTPGAYPGIQAEEQGQGEAIASCISLFSGLTVPVIATVTGEGGSGGALALATANRVLMLENAIYSILSPEGFATILWKDVKRKDEAAKLMGLTAEELYENSVVDVVIPEGLGGIRENTDIVMEILADQIYKNLKALLKLNGSALAKDRYERFRKLGTFQVRPQPF